MDKEAGNIPSQHWVIFYGEVLENIKDREGEYIYDWTPACRQAGFTSYE